MSLFINDINLNMEIKFDFEILCKNIRVLDLYDLIFECFFFFKVVWICVGLLFLLSNMFVLN